VRASRRGKISLRQIDGEKRTSATCVVDDIDGEDVSHYRRE